MICGDCKEEIRFVPEEVECFFCNTSGRDVLGPCDFCSGNGYSMQDEAICGCDEEDDDPFYNDHGHDGHDDSECA
jgi:hypothetical protein